MNKKRAENFCPYKGLQPYDQMDGDYFFGRNKDTEIIISNLYASPLTVLYGASGVGKSSVLQAGVARKLKEEKDVVVVVFRHWQDENFLSAFKSEVLRAVKEKTEKKTPNIEVNVDETLPLDKFLSKCIRASHCLIFFILDQFEEYFLYHPDSIDLNGYSFEAQFARAVNRQDVNAHFLLAMRDDGLSKLDRFQRRIPTIMGNLLRLDHLDRDSAEEAILGPLATYNKELAQDPPVKIEAALFNDLLEDLRTGRVTLDLAGQGQVQTNDEASDGAEDVRIETPFLQMVLTRLWDDERKAGSNVLRRSTYQSLADEKTNTSSATMIVRTHLDEVMKNELADKESQKIAAKLFHQLVTPGGMKIAHTSADLIFFAKQPANRVNSVINLLSSPEVRILRPVSPPIGLRGVERYEIFHDVLAQPILAWTTNYFQEREKEEAASQAAEKAAQEEVTKGARRFRFLAIAMAVMFLIAALSAVYALWQSRELKRVNGLLEQKNGELKKTSNDLLDAYHDLQANRDDLMDANSNLITANTDLVTAQDQLKAQKVIAEAKASDARRQENIAIAYRKAADQSRLAFFAAFGINPSIAGKATEEIERGRGQGDGEDEGQDQETLNHFDDARRSYERLGDLRNQGQALNATGDYCAGATVKLTDVRNKSRAVENYKRALISYHSAHDSRGEAETYFRLGVFYVVHLEADQDPITYFEQARQRYSKLNAPNEELRTIKMMVDHLTPLAGASASRAKLIETLMREAAVYHQINKPKSEAIVFTRLAGVYEIMQDTQNEVDSLMKTVRLYQSQNDCAGRKAVLMKIAHIYDSLGDRPKADEFSKQADELHCTQ